MPAVAATGSLRFWNSWKTRPMKAAEAEALIPDALLDAARR